jgi:hypothetical protein
MKELLLFWPFSMILDDTGNKEGCNSDGAVSTLQVSTRAKSAQERCSALRASRASLCLPLSAASLAATRRKVGARGIILDDALELILHKKHWHSSRSLKRYKNRGHPSRWIVYVADKRNSIPCSFIHWLPINTRPIYPVLHLPSPHCNRLHLSSLNSCRPLQPICTSSRTHIV